MSRQGADERNRARGRQTEDGKESDLRTIRRSEFEVPLFHSERLARRVDPVPFSDKTG